jgi:hypothetical protein
MAAPSSKSLTPPDPDQPGTDPSCAVPPPDSNEPATLVNRPSLLRDQPIPAIIPPAADSIVGRLTDIGSSSSAALTVRNPGERPKPSVPIADRPIPKPAADTPAKAKEDTKPTLRPMLRVVRGEIPGQPFPVLDGKNFIGRATPDKPMDIDMTAQERVEQVWVSRQHAVITLAGEMLIVEDLNSLNGTFVNRVRIYPGQPRVLQPGDLLQVGTVQMKVEV